LYLLKPKAEIMAVLAMKPWISPVEDRPNVNNERQKVPYKWPNHRKTTAFERKYCPRTEVKLNNEVVTAYIDNASGLSFISEELAKAMKLKINQQEKEAFVTVNGHDSTLGTTEPITIAAQRISVQWKLHVIPNHRIKLLLGNDWLYHVNAVIRVSTNTLFITLGHIIGKGLLQPDNTNLNKIKIAPVPNDFKTLRAFFGLTGYYRIFVEKYAKLAKPLTTLLKNLFLVPMLQIMH
jgi:hypothetical protein